MLIIKIINNTFYALFFFCPPPRNKASKIFYLAEKPASAIETDYSADLPVAHPLH